LNRFFRVAAIFWLSRFSGCRDFLVVAIFWFDFAMAFTSNQTLVTMQP